jgi:hypothetical protein
MVPFLLLSKLSFQLQPLLFPFSASRNTRASFIHISSLMPFLLFSRWMPRTMSKCYGSQPSGLAHLGRPTVRANFTASNTPPSPSTPLLSTKSASPRRFRSSLGQHGPLSRRHEPRSPAWARHLLPFLIGVNTRNHRHRQLYSAGIRCFTGFTSYDFTAGYSLSHCTYANDSTLCLCHACPPRLFTCEHILTQCPIHSTPRQP